MRVCIVLLLSCCCAHLKKMEEIIFYSKKEIKGIESRLIKVNNRGSDYLVHLYLGKYFQIFDLSQYFPS